MNTRDKKGWFKKGHKFFGPKNKKVCNLCGRKYLPKGHNSLYCSECRVIKIKGWKRKYDRSERRRIKAREYFHKEENRPKYQARWWVNDRLRKGKIIKPNKCHVCGLETNKLCGHHYLGYLKEHRLDVQWLCGKCHYATREGGG